MSELMMKGAVRPAKVMFEYRVGEDWRTQHTIEHGVNPPAEFVVTFDLVDLTPKQRERALRLAAPASQVSRTRNPFLRHPELAHPTDDVEAVLNAWEDHLAKVDLESLNEGDAGDSEVSRAEFLREMGAWVAQHGSTRLRRALERGYRATGIYVEERALKEMPDFFFDRDGRVVFREALNPSAEALELETQTLQRMADHSRAASEVRIVWMTDAPSEWPDELLPGEAIFVKFLGHGRLFRPVADTDLALRALAWEAR
ncbi:MAG: hypothetical protein M3340_15045 [Actinomycetota bacterium]|nr:hypothetical protein [Actinomycetota bacterium]